MRLLLAEDDAALSSGLQQRLNREGFAVDIANNWCGCCLLGA